jgi:hypothetical protein
MERWPSGLRHALAKRAALKGARGFESRPLRWLFRFLALLKS